MVDIENLKEAMDEMFDFICDMPSGLDGFESDFDAAFDELKKVESALRWIPVAERLPEKGEIVLACGKRHATSGMFQGALRNNPKLWHWKGNTLKEVTHWMPLPEPPKEDE